MSPASQPAKPKEIGVGEILVLAEHFRIEAAKEDGTIAGRLRAHKLSQLLNEVIDRRANTYIETVVIERRMRDRCFHDFIEFIDETAGQYAEGPERTALLAFGGWIVDRGPAGLGEGTCACDQPDCPYREEVADAQSSQ